MWSASLVGVCRHHDYYAHMFCGSYRAAENPLMLNNNIRLNHLFNVCRHHDYMLTVGGCMYRASCNLMAITGLDWTDYSLMEPFLGYTTFFPCVYCGGLQVYA